MKYSNNPEETTRVNKNAVSGSKKETFLTIFILLHFPECLSEHNGSHGLAKSRTPPLEKRFGKNESARPQCIVFHWGCWTKMRSSSSSSPCALLHVQLSMTEVQTLVVAFEGEKHLVQLLSSLKCSLHSADWRRIYSAPTQWFSPLPLLVLEVLGSSFSSLLLNSLKTSQSQTYFVFCFFFLLLQRRCCRSIYASGQDSHLHAGRRTQLKLKSLLKHIASPQTCTHCSTVPSLNIIAHIKSKLGKPCRHLPLFFLFFSIFGGSAYTQGEITECRRISTTLPDEFLRIPVQLLRTLVCTSLKTQQGRSTCIWSLPCSKEQTQAGATTISSLPTMPLPLYFSAFSDTHIIVGVTLIWMPLV